MVYFKSIPSGVELETHFIPKYFDNWCKENRVEYKIRIKLDTQHNKDRVRMLFEDEAGLTAFVLRWQNAWD
jgi:hypothetical protein